MAFFPRSVYAQDQSLAPIFRLLGDLDAYSRPTHRQQCRPAPRQQIFKPKFDVREVEDAYELHGELAGMNKEDVHIEFTDPQTLHIHGSIARLYTTTPAKNEDELMSGALSDAGDEFVEVAPTSPAPSYQATVEDAEAEEKANTAAPATAEVTVTEKDEKKESKPVDSAKYWVTERSIGQFSRGFNFPQRVEQDAVTAKLDAGILSIRVPKARKHESIRIPVV